MACATPKFRAYSGRIHSRLSSCVRVGCSEGPDGLLVDGGGSKFPSITGGVRNGLDLTQSRFSSGPASYLLSCVIQQTNLSLTALPYRIVEITLRPGAPPTRLLEQSTLPSSCEPARHAGEIVVRPKCHRKHGPMTNTGSEVRRGTLRWPNQRGVNPHVVLQAATEQAWSTVAEGEQVYDVHLEGGIAEPGNEAVMIWSYSYQVVQPGGSAGVRLR